MRISLICNVMILSMVLAFAACSNNGKTPASDLVPSTPADASAPPATTTTVTPQQPASPATNAAGVYHYTCSNGCAGGSGTAGACATCGAQLAHNQAYHDGPASSTTPTTNTQTTITPPTQTTPSPAQNAAGVYHYTCSNGCAGGSGTAGTCASCGGQLAHNQAYHN